MNKRLKSIVCATVATCSLLVVQSSIKVGSIGVDAVSAATESAAPAPAPAPAATTTKTTTTRSTSNYIAKNGSSILVLGSNGDAVKSLQTSLNNNGYKLDVDGFFGNLTLQAVKDFQKQRGLVVDGVVGPETFAELNPTTPTVVLNVGSTGSDVRFLQKNLNKVGYKLVADGIFGNLTLNAVKDFQKSTNLKVDGLAGAKTFAKLNEKVAAVATAVTPAPKPAPSPIDTTPAAPPVDAVATASVVDNVADFQKAIGANGKWIIAITKDVTTDQELFVDGVFKNGKKDANGNDTYQRKIALYTQDAKHKVTGHFTLTAPKIIFNSPYGSLEHGTFKGDVYVSGKNFKLVNQVVDGNIYFLNKEAQDTFTIADKADDQKTVITGKQELKTPIKIGRADYFAHGKGFAIAAVAMAGDKIAAVSVDDYQFMDPTKVTSVPNTEALSANYKDSTKSVLASKLTNKAYYSANMKAEGGATQDWDVNMSAIEKFATGKTIAELDEAIKGNSTDPKVDAVTGATFKDTNGYLKAILAAANDAAKADTSFAVDDDQVNSIKIGRADYFAHGKGFTVPVVAMIDDKIAAVSVDDYQFMDPSKVTPVPNTASLSANYKDPTKSVLASKLTNKAYYSANMKAEGGATQDWDVNMNAIEEFTIGKTITELDEAIKGNSTDPKVDAVTGATFKDTNGYLKAILAAAKVAK